MRLQFRSTKNDPCLDPISHRRTHAGNYWIGLNDNKVSLSYEWSDDSVVLFTNWNTYEPNNYNGKNEDCVETYSDVKAHFMLKILTYYSE